MGRLYETLAVEADKKGIATRILEESTRVFKDKHNLFQGGTKTLSMLEEGQSALEDANSEIKEVSTTVGERLDYTVGPVSDWLDVTLQKEATNQIAVADLVVDGEVLAENLPATFLLGLEDKLKGIRKMYNEVPTLSPTIIWEDNVNGKANTFRSKNLEVKTKTQKVPKSHIEVAPTEFHPAQISRWNEEVVVGKYETSHLSGMVSSERKMQLLGRVDKLIQATKQARMRANGVEVIKSRVGADLFKYINQ